MLGRLLGPSSTVGMLKEGLDETSQRLRGIAHRVANVTNGVDDGFGNAMEQVAQNGVTEPQGVVDLEREMVELANEQIRFDASATLLQRMYAQLRASLKGA